MADEIPVSFEVRCKGAKELLYQWTRFHEMPVEIQRRREERIAHKNKIFALLSDPLQVGLERLLVNPGMLERFLKLVRAMYGDDATEFALKTMKTDGFAH